MKTIYEFWEGEGLTALGDIGPTTRFLVLHESSSRLLFRKEFQDAADFRRFYDEFCFEGLREKLKLTNLPASQFLLRHYPCGVSEGDVLTLTSGFVQDEPQAHDFMKRVGWTFTVVGGDREFPGVVWLQAQKDGSQQKYFPVQEESIIHRFKKG